MKNILGTTKDLELFNKDGKRVYKFGTSSNGVSYECTYDEKGNELTYKNSNGDSYEYTYDEKGNELTFKNSNGFSYEYTRDENGNVLTYKNSDGYSRECTYDEKDNELTFKDSDGDYKIKGKYVTKEEYKSFINGTPEYTMEQLVEKIGHNFKIKK
jgi:YD repeat-containing protein